jgi:hypothetical protein
MMYNDSATMLMLADEEIVLPEEGSMIETPVMSVCKASSLRRPSRWTRLIGMNAMKLLRESALMMVNWLVGVAGGAGKWMRLLPGEMMKGLVTTGMSGSTRTSSRGMGGWDGVDWIGTVGSLLVLGLNLGREVLVLLLLDIEEREVDSDGRYLC